jgi:uncharacterized membrane protein
MTPWIRAGVSIVLLALLCYTIATAAHQRERKVSRHVIRFLSLGLSLDIVATACMIMGTQSKGVTLHAVLGFSALFGMLVETVLAWRHRAAHGERPVSERLALYSRVAYAYWVIAFISGGMMVAMAARRITDHS